MRPECHESKPKSISPSLCCKKILELKRKDIVGIEYMSLNFKVSNEPLYEVIHL
jgi:hypothetical protein